MGRAGVEAQWGGRNRWQDATSGASTVTFNDKNLCGQTDEQYKY